MLLEKLLDSLDVNVRPFAVCNVHTGWKMRLPPADSVVLHFVLKGSGRFSSEERPPQDFGPGFLILVPRSIEHNIETSSPTGRVMTLEPSSIGPSAESVNLEVGDGEDDVVLACGRVEATSLGGAGLFDGLHCPVIQDFSDTPTVEGVFRTILDEQQKGFAGGGAMASALMTQCFVMLLRRLCSEPECRLPWLVSLEDDRIARVVDAILDDPSAPHSVDSLAELAGMARSTFSEKFGHAFGRTATDFVRDSRLREASRLLRTTELPIKVVAVRVGFSSRSYFSEAFTEQFGLSPGRYRTERPA